MNLMNSLNQFYYDMSLLELRLMNKNTACQNISYNSLLYLDLISFKKKSTVSQLAELLNVSKSAVTIKVNELIRQGFITKTQSEKDKRVFFLDINPELEQNYKNFDKKLASTLKALEGLYSQKEIKMFDDMLTVIHKNYQYNGST